MRFIIALLLILLIALAGAFFFPRALHTEKYVDFDPPQVSLERIGTNLVIKYSDSLSGITSILLKITQSDPVQLEKVLDLPIDENGVSQISLARAAKDLKKGEATFTAISTDKSQWKNQATSSLTITPDFVSPQLSVLSLQHKMYAGGAELVIFEARDNEEIIELSLSIGEKNFIPIRLADVDEKYSAFPDAYGVLFAVPRGFPEAEFKPVLVAKDSFGNATRYPLSLRFVEKPLKESSPSLSQRFLERKIPPLVEEMKREDLISSDEELPGLEAFMQVNQTYREALGQRLEALLATRVTTSLPKTPFVRPMAGSLMSAFGEARNYTFEKQPAGYSTHDGQDIASVRGDKVVATYSGEVILAEPFGIYGNAVAVDHGFGISSLYGHLSTIAVEVGEKLEKGQLLGKSGETGLAGGDHLHFEIRVQNVPVTPIEWWDKKWFDDNILLKLDVLQEAVTEQE